MVSACHVCGQEAVERCFNCGKLFCPEHGRENCYVCENGIAPGDRRADRISSKRLRDEGDGVAWWRPQQAEDFEPPACVVCGGLTRTNCKNCADYYCREHAGPHGLCGGCGQSSRLGLIFLLGCLGFLAVLGVWGLLQSP